MRQKGACRKICVQGPLSPSKQTSTFATLYDVGDVLLFYFYGLIRKVRVCDIRRWSLMCVCDCWGAEDVILFFLYNCEFLLLLCSPYIYIIGALSLPPFIKNYKIQLNSTERYVTCYTWFALERLWGLGLSLASSLTSGCQSIFVLRHIINTLIWLPMLLGSARQVLGVTKFCFPVSMLRRWKERYRRLLLTQNILFTHSLEASRQADVLEFLWHERTATIFYY